MSDILKKVAEVFDAEESSLVELAKMASSAEWINLTARRDELVILRASVLDLLQEEL